MPFNDRYPTINLREYPEYVPRNTVGLTLSAAAYSFGAGVFAAAVKNSLLKPKGAGYLHPRTGFYVYLFSKYSKMDSIDQVIHTHIRRNQCQLVVEVRKIG